MVRLRAVGEPAVLRRITQGDGNVAAEDGFEAVGNGGVVRMQAFEDSAVLRRVAWEVGNRTGCAGVGVDLKFEISD